MRVYFVRHGESEGNAGGIHQSATTPLSDVGVSQAKILAHRFKNIPVDLLISSNYARAHSTANEISKVIKKEVELDSDLREIVRPSEIVGKKTNEPEVVAIKKLIKQHIHEPDWHYSDEENFTDFLKRAHLVLEKIQNLNVDTVTVVTHGSFLRAMLCAMVFGEQSLPQDLVRIEAYFHLDNTGLTLCSYEINSGWKLLHWNDYSHLG